MRTLRWGLASAAMVLVVVGAVMFGSWYSYVSDWHPTGDGMEGRLYVELWPPKLVWNARLP